MTLRDINIIQSSLSLSNDRGFVYSNDLSVISLLEVCCLVDVFRFDIDNYEV